MRPRRTWMLLALGSLLIPSLAASGCTPDAPSPGQIELSAKEFDFGAIPSSDTVSQVFQVRNTGGEELEITAVTTSCGCTTAEVDSHRLAPGASTDLTVTYDPQVHGGAAGEFMRLVYVRSNDPITPEASLVIRVTVMGPEASSDTIPSRQEIPLQAAQMDPLQPMPELAANDIEITSLYQTFACPCCGQDIGSCTCGMAGERRGFIDQHMAFGATEGQTHRAMFQAYGTEAFFDQELAAKVRTALLAELPADRPVIVAEPAQMDLGKVPIGGGLVSPTYMVVNAGKTDLTITSLQTSCGCTTAVLETSQGTSPVFGGGPSEETAGWSAVLTPGEVASVIVTFDPMAHGPDATGEFKRVISVVSNDPLNARLDVTFDVEVVK